jgi:hypothetical protein
MREKLTPVPSQLTCKRKRVKNPTGHVQRVTQSALRYEVLRVNSHYHGLDDILMFNVTCREPGSANTMKPYSSLHHLDVLTEYEQRFESNPDSKDY